MKIVRCSFCGKKIETNERYLIIKDGSVCKDCGNKFIRGRNEVFNSVFNDGDSRTDSDE